MADEETLYPFEVLIQGVPRSQQAEAHSRSRWKELVAETARKRQRETYELGFLDDRALAVTIYYFPDAPMTGDVDNIVKPILDSLIAIAYLDDDQVERVTVQKFEPDGGWEFLDPSEMLAAALDTPPPLLYVRVDDDLSWKVL